MIFRNCVRFPAAGGSGVIGREYLSTRLEHNDTLSLDSSSVVWGRRLFHLPERYRCSKQRSIVYRT